MLHKYEDFQQSTTIVEEVITAKGHLCQFLPSFHYELNPIEGVWCHAKKYTRAQAKKDSSRMLGRVSKDMISCFCKLV